MIAKSNHPKRGEPQRPARSRRLRRLVAATIGLVLRLVRGLVATAALATLLAGLPWALWHYIGWPLPQQVPTWDAVRAVLMTPMTATFLLNLLACLCWLAWAVFAVGVIRCTIETIHDGLGRARLPRRSATGPVHALAAVLVGAIALSILGQRTAASSTAAPSTTVAATPTVVATAPAWHAQPELPTVGVREPVLANPGTSSPSASASARPESVVVRPPDPHTGVHDSLWRIARRTLGDGARWPQIFALNKGKPQPNGGTFTNPHLIFPGEELILPANEEHAAPPEPPPRANQPAPPAEPPAPAEKRPPPPNSTPASPHAPARSSSPATPWQEPAPAFGQPGFSWGAELFVGLGLAAAVSAALLVARRRHRARYRPGSGRRDDLPVAPVVYQLRLAHLHTHHDDEPEADPAGQGTPRPTRNGHRPRPEVVAAEERTGTGAGAGAAARFPLEVGVRDGREIALELASARGLGLVGEGSPAALRALLLAALTAPHAATAGSDDPRVIVAGADLAAELAPGHSDTPPPGMQVVPTLDDALDALETATLHRAHATHRSETDAWSPLALVAHTPLHGQRAQAVLDNGSEVGIVGLLLGQWPSGVTAYIRADGTVSATNPGLGENLRSARMFHLSDGHATDLLDLLQQARPEPNSNETGDEQARPPEHAVAAANPALEVTATVDNPVTAGPLEIVVPERPPVSPPTMSDEDTLGVARQDIPQRTQAEKDPPAAETEPVAAPAATGGKQSEEAAPLRITVFGPPRVCWQAEPDDALQEITGVLQPRARELLVFLALHPDGTSREALAAALWPDSPPERITNALNTALSRLRHALATATEGTLGDAVTTSNGRYRLDPALAEVDYWNFEHARTTCRAATTDDAKIHAYRAVVEAYGGPLADGMATEWIEPAREAIRRDAIDAVAALARALVEHDPAQTLDLLELARAFDPHNELLYRDIMRLQERLGRLDAIERTLTLLRTRLAELDEQPTAQAVNLAAGLRQRHEDQPAARPNAPIGHDSDSGRRATI